MFKKAIEIQEIPENRKCGYPEPFKSRMGDRAKRRLSDAFGLKQYGVNHVTLGPGGQSALRHFHSHEDEFTIVLEGELTLVTNTGEQTIRAGMCVGFPANTGDAHHLINKSDKPAVYIEIGSRIDADNGYYPDDDLCWLTDDKGVPFGAHKNGASY